MNSGRKLGGNIYCASFNELLEKDIHPEIETSGCWMGIPGGSPISISAIGSIFGGFIGPLSLVFSIM